MKTKEAIEKVCNKYEGWQGYARTQKEADQLGKERDGIIELLERGEENKKYKKIWEELYEIASEFNFFPLMDKIKQKYFQREADTNETKMEK